MTANRYARTASLRRRVLRFAGLLMLLATMQKAMPATAAPAYWSIKVGRPSAGCQRGLGICIDLFGSAGAAATEVAIEVDSTRKSPAGQQTARMVFLSPLQEKGDTFEVEEDVVLDRRHSLELGFQQVTILKGRYPIDRSDGGNGEVLIALRTIGITVTIDIGRKSMGCTRAGICSITVGLDFARQNQAPAVVALEERAMLIDFLGRPHSGSEPFVLDEDLVIHRDLAARLGRQEITLKAGTYAIDYSENPNGRLVIPVGSQGIVVTIYIGRPSQNCRGFGFCGITVEDKVATERTVPAAVSIRDGVMSVDLLGETPESGDVLTIDEDLTLDAATARRLRYPNIVLKRGSYRVDRRGNPFGTIEIPVETAGISIEIHIGRTSLCNPGFGICRIVIDRFGLNAENDRVAFAAATETDRNLMTLSFSERTRLAEDTLVVDQDVLIEGTTGAPLGGEQGIVVKRGAYAVDYSSNPAGTVTVVTEVVSAASVESAGSTQTGLALWPNPATTTATTSFFVDASRTVRLELLDAHGTVVLTAIDGERLERGTHERTLDLAGLPAGAYFERLTVGATSSVRPLQILR